MNRSTPPIFKDPNLTPRAPLRRPLNRLRRQRLLPPSIVNPFLERLAALTSMLGPVARNTRSRTARSTLANAAGRRVVDLTGAAGG